MAMDLIDCVINGGCYWAVNKINARQSSHSICLENGTYFKISVDGPLSNAFVGGKCSESYFQICDGKLAGRNFESASKAVNTIRAPSSNAFLYIYFLIDGNWFKADDLRMMEWSNLDKVQEISLEIAIDLLKKKIKIDNELKAQFDDNAKITRGAATLVKKNAFFTTEARRRLEY